jgi:predicted alpha/beta superfamily hydrolase
MRLHPAALLLALVVAPTLAPAQALAPRPVPTDGIQAFHLRSPATGVTYEVLVATPPSYAASPTRRYPLMVVTDGFRTFFPMVDAVRALASSQVAPEMLVVSVGTPQEDGDDAWVRRRVYEFSPPGWARTDPFGTIVTAACQRVGSAPDRCTGGAPAFLGAIVNEVLPQITRQYRVDPNDLALFGVSAGGFFASWAMFQPSSPFHKYIISSGAMAYGDGEVFRAEAAWGASHTDFPKGVYLSVGSLEADDPFLEGAGRIVSGTARLAAALRGRNYPGLSMTMETLPGLGHSDAAPTAMVRGIRSLYKAPPPAGGR